MNDTAIDHELNGEGDTQAAPEPRSMLFDDMMVDIETLAVHTSKAVILSFALVPFRMTDESPKIGKPVIILPSVNQQIGMLGRRADENTQKFWNDQTPAARAHWSDPSYEYRGIKPRHIIVGKDATFSFDDLWAEQMDKAARIWANGIVFDLGNLENLFDCQMPWQYNAARDARTLFRHVKKTRQRPADIKFDNLHDPVEDCLNQIWGLWELWPALDQESFT